MAYSINGIGTSFCFARGSGSRGGDALECVVIAFMPIIPLKAFHLHGVEFLSGRYQAVPIRLTTALVARVFLLYWLTLPLVVGISTALMSTDPTFITAGWLMSLLCGVGYFALWRIDNRTRQIRHLLGQHQYGTSDPAMWTHEILSTVRSSQEMFGTPTFSAAVPVLLENRNIQAAMWAARLTAVLEDSETAESLTDEILSNSQNIQ